MLSRINDILDLSKIESGKVVLMIGEFALSDMLASIDAIIRPAAKAKNQNFEVTMTELAHEELISDETRFNQILINLLSNAVKYTQEGGNIQLRLTGLEQHSSQYTHIRIEVEDNGYGMTPEYLETKEGCLRKRHFLVADNTEILAELLYMEEAACEIVGNGKLAVERFEQAPLGSYDAILMDA